MTTTIKEIIDSNKRPTERALENRLPWPNADTLQYMHVAQRRSGCSSRCMRDATNRRSPRYDVTGRRATRTTQDSHSHILDPTGSKIFGSVLNPKILDPAGSVPDPIHSELNVWSTGMVERSRLEPFLILPSWQGNSWPHLLVLAPSTLRDYFQNMATYLKRSVQGCYQELGKNFCFFIIIWNV